MVQPPPALAQSDDWPRAVELMKAGQNEAALPFLERLVSANPGNKIYRFQLALALFRLNHDFRAKWHLDQVRGAGLDDNEARMVGHYLTEIEARSVWSGHLSVALKPESNATQQTSDSHISVGGMDFALTPDSRAKPGVSLVVATGLAYSPRIGERLKASFSLEAYLRHSDNRSLRDYQLTARSGLEYLPDARSRIAGGLLLGHRWLAEQPYSRTGGIWADYTRLAGSRGRLDLGAEFSHTQYDMALPDSRRSLVTASYSHAVSGSARVTLTGLLEETRGAALNLAGTRAAVSLSGLYAWDGGLMTSLRMGYQVDDRRGPEPFFGVTLHDRKTSLDLTLYHRNFRIGNFAPQLVIGIDSNRSNIPLAAYKNQYLSIGLTRDF